MPLSKLSITNLRGIVKADIDFVEGVNLLRGINASGKTSVIESLSLLSHGRSYVTSNTKELINFDAKELTVRVELDPLSTNQTLALGLDRQGNKKIRLNGEKQKTQHSLAQALPALYVTPKSFQFIEGSSKERRRWIDWSVFHVKHQFAELLQKLNKTLAQRNAALKQTKTQKNQSAKENLFFWDQSFSDTSQQVVEARNNTLLEIKPFLDEEMEYWLPYKTMQTIEHPGWGQTAELIDQLHKDHNRDIAQGFTGKGAHRYDIDFVVDKHRANTVLSRGEKKRFVFALLFAQLRHAQTQRIEPLVAIDDLGAELDEQGWSQLCLKAKSSCKQLIVTMVEDSNTKASNLLHADRMFHVKHGQVAQEQL